MKQDHGNFDSSLLQAINFAEKFKISNDCLARQKKLHDLSKVNKFLRVLTI